MDNLRHDLSKYRLDRAKLEKNEARESYERGNYYRAITSSYYAMFHAVRSILAYDGFDAKKHATVIGYFNKNYVATGILEKRYAKMLTSSFDMRHNSDYKDFFTATQEDALEQVSAAEAFIDAVDKYLVANYYFEE